VSPPLCNIYASFCFFIEAERWRECGCLTQIAALNVAEVISRVGLKPEIKWPNDLLIQGKKVGGILMEVTPVDSTYFVVLGIGLNVNMSLEDLSLVNRAATSLTVESGCQFDLEDILKQLEDRFVSDYLLFLQKGFSPFAAAYLEKVQGLLGQEIVYQQGNVQGHGLVESMTDEGFLWLRLPDGTAKLLSSGELL